MRDVTNNYCYVAVTVQPRPHIGSVHGRAALHPGRARRRVIKLETARFGALFQTKTERVTKLGESRTDAESAAAGAALQWRHQQTAQGATVAAGAAGEEVQWVDGRHPERTHADLGTVEERVSTSGTGFRSAGDILIYIHIFPIYWYINLRKT